MSIFNVHGVRCDYCGKFSNRGDGEYTKPGGVSAGYIRQANYENDNGTDICEECAAGRCPHCASDQIVRVTPMTPGPTGWGGRCKACGQRWDMIVPAAEEFPDDGPDVEGCPDHEPIRQRDFI